MTENNKRPIKRISKTENSKRGRKSSNYSPKRMKKSSSYKVNKSVSQNSSNKKKTVNKKPNNIKINKSQVNTSKGISKISSPKTKTKTMRKPKNAFEAITFKLGDLYRANPVTFYWIFVGVISVIFAIIALSCIADVMGTGRSHETKSINIPDGATTNQIINILDKENMIKNSLFCKMFVGVTQGLTKKSKPKYLSGVYYLSPDMGVEKMLLSCMRRNSAKTVRITIPEGLTLDQIALKLEKADVCTSKQFFKTVDEGNFDFDFVKSIPNKSQKYRILEGYLYPDTYDFYVADNPTSVINTMLKNTQKNWTADFDAKAKNLNMSMDEVLTLASIIQKEAANKSQMEVISSILHKRLNGNKYPLLQCDSTGDYVTKNIKPNIKPEEFTKYQTLYNTYYCKKLPVGSICNPGKDAINAALNPKSTEYYFFNHDNSGKIYLAKTDSEHEENVYKAMVANNAKK